MTPTPPPWSLDAQLARDTAMIGDLPLARILLMNDANYPWLILVPRRSKATEILDLSEAEQAQLMGEITLTARALKATVECDKLNIAAIGNVVAQLHVHIVARRRDDPAWPRPVWGAAAARPYKPTEQQRLIETLRPKVPGLKEL